MKNLFSRRMRLVDLLERGYPGFPGFNLSFEVREGLARHATVYDRPAPEREFAATPSPRSCTGASWPAA